MRKLRCKSRLVSPLFRLAILFSRGIAVLQSDPGFAQELVRGPYVQALSKSGVTIRWRTDIPCPGILAHGLHWTSIDTVVTEVQPTTEHEITVRDLLAGTRYYYAIASSPSTLLAGRDPDHFFVTSPPIGSKAPQRIWVVGDSGDANPNVRAVRDAYLDYTSSRPADVWLMLGDNAYDFGRDFEYQISVFNTFPTILRNTCLWPSFGNHDAFSAQSHDESGVYYDIFHLPRQGESEGFPSGTEAYYSHERGNIHFVCLDSQGSSRVAPSSMLDWLRQDLSRVRRDWIIAYWHHPPYSRGSHNSDRERELTEMRENAVPILEEFGVDLVLSGHSHAYERSRLINGHFGDAATFGPEHVVDGGDGREDGSGAYQKNPGPRTGAVYVVSGSASRRSLGTFDHPAMVSNQYTWGSLIIDVDATRLDLNFLDRDGVVQDYFTLLKNPQGIRHYGAGTAGSDGRIPRIDASSELVAGNADFRVTVRNCRPFSQVTLFFGRGRSNDPGVGGTHLTTERFFLKAETGARGRVAFSLPIPDNSELSGRVFFQAVVQDSNGAEGVALSDGLRADLDR